MSVVTSQLHHGYLSILVLQMSVCLFVYTDPNMILVLKLILVV